jgi:hypothetical protein
MVTHPDDGGQPDGLNWLVLDGPAKYAYVCGFVAGLFQGHCFTTWSLPGGGSNDSVYVSATQSFDGHWKRFVAEASYDQFVQGLDKFYSDERNSKIEIHHGLWVVMNILSGISEESLAIMIDSWRHKDGNTDANG